MEAAAYAVQRELDHDPTRDLDEGVDYDAAKHHALIFNL
jgi:hypothetical protein